MILWTLIFCEGALLHWNSVLRYLAKCRRTELCKAWNLLGKIVRIIYNHSDQSHPLQERVLLLKDERNLVSDLVRIWKKKFKIIMRPLMSILMCLLMELSESGVSSSGSVSVVNSKIRNMKGMKSFIFFHSTFDVYCWNNNQYYISHP